MADPDMMDTETLFLLAAKLSPLYLTPSPPRDSPSSPISPVIYGGSNQSMDNLLQPVNGDSQRPLPSSPNTSALSVGTSSVVVYQQKTQQLQPMASDDGLESAERTEESQELINCFRRTPSGPGNLVPPATDALEGLPVLGRTVCWTQHHIHFLIYLKRQHSRLWPWGIIDQLLPKLAVHIEEVCQALVQIYKKTNRVQKYESQITGKNGTRIVFHLTIRINHWILEENLYEVLAASVDFPIISRQVFLPPANYTIEFGGALVTTSYIEENSSKGPSLDSLCDQLEKQLVLARTLIEKQTEHFHDAAWTIRMEGEGTGHVVREEAQLNSWCSGKKRRRKEKTRRGERCSNVPTGVATAISLKLNASTKEMRQACWEYGNSRWPPREEQKRINQSCPNESSMVVGLERHAQLNPDQEKTKGVRIEITLEDIFKVAGLKIEDAAETLDVSKSTLKRVCRTYGIPRWPPRNIENLIYQSRPKESPVNDDILPSDQPSGATDDKSSVRLMVRCVDNNNYIIPLSRPWKMSQLERKLEERQQKPGTYYMKYKYEGGVPITILCEEDLQTCISSCRPPGTNLIELFLESK